jgi:hypothetical protein
MLEDISCMRLASACMHLFGKLVYGLASRVARSFRFEGLDGDVTPWIAYDPERRPQDKWCG